MSQLLAAIGQLILIVIERLAYLYRSALTKICLQVFTVVFVHVMIFFVVPLEYGV